MQKQREAIKNTSSRPGVWDQADERGFGRTKSSHGTQLPERTKEMHGEIL